MGIVCVRINGGYFIHFKLSLKWIGYYLGYQLQLIIVVSNKNTTALHNIFRQPFKRLPEYSASRYFGLFYAENHGLNRKLFVQ